ncbi:hypothetical protein [Amycolatopsis sp. NPDC059657]|uniref:hypothetical protein n=1 Tax=Amycolatopsis sp. NPDC059657 TaxID=3346899 RepID=UPI00366CAA85
MDPAIKAVAGFITVILAGVVVITASSGSPDTDIAVRVTVPSGAQSLYAYRGSAPGPVSDWSHCFPLNGDAGTRTPTLPASPGQRHWNFLAYAAPGCPVSGGDEPFATARNITAPTDLTTWSVVLRPRRS